MAKAGRASGSPRKGNMSAKQPNGGFASGPGSARNKAKSPNGSGAGVNFGLKPGTRATPAKRSSPYGGNSAPA